MPLLEAAITFSGWTPTSVLHGANMNSPDRLARAWARSRGIPERGIDADWSGVRARGLPVGAAGPLRNGILAKSGDVLVALWDGASPGTKDMIRQMRHTNKPIVVYRLDGSPHERYPAQLGLFSS